MPRKTTWQQGLAEWAADEYVKQLPFSLEHCDDDRFKASCFIAPGFTMEVKSASSIISIEKLQETSAYWIAAWVLVQLKHGGPLRC